MHGVLSTSVRVQGAQRMGRRRRARLQVVVASAVLTLRVAEWHAVSIQQQRRRKRRRRQAGDLADKARVAPARLPGGVASEAVSRCGSTGVSARSRPCRLRHPQKLRVQAHPGGGSGRWCAGQGRALRSTPLSGPQRACSASSVRGSISGALCHTSSTGRLQLCTSRSTCCSSGEWRWGCVDVRGHDCDQLFAQRCR